MDKRIPITVQGAEKLRAELDELKRVKRPAVVAAVAEAREKGDLSENAEYDAAKEMQGHIEGRIAELEGKLPMLQIIDPKSLQAGDRIVFGATVELEDEDSGEVKTYQWGMTKRTSRPPVFRFRAPWPAVSSVSSKVTK